MEVIKRNQTRESVKLEKITKRIARQSKDLKNVDVTTVAQKVIQGLYDGVTTQQLDALAIDTAYGLSVKHPDYDKLAVRLAITALHKKTQPTFSLAMNKLQENKNPRGEVEPILSEVVDKFINKNSAILDASIDQKRDFNFDFFGYKTLERYLLTSNGQIIERPQYLWMRVACGIHFDDIEAAIQTYNLLSTFQFTHATPTLLHSGKEKNQLFSCYLKSINDNQDSIKGIYGALAEVAELSKYAGGIGFHIHDIRSKGQYIRGGGNSDGIIPMLKVWNETARYCNQSGKRKGSFAAYLEPWHPDFSDFLNIRKNNGKEELRARDLFTAGWIPDLFFVKVENDQDWYIMDPYVSKCLADCYDEGDYMERHEIVSKNGEDSLPIDRFKFTNLYNKYVSEGKFVAKIKARDLYQEIFVSQMETGTPYLLAKDACNRKNNQKNIGTIRSSNLCAEIVEYSSPQETAVCVLGSMSLPAYVEGRKGKKKFNFDKLQENVEILTQNLNKAIDYGFYPIESAKTSNFKHRPIGIGVQGLANVFAMMRFSWESEDAKKLNKDIAETIYYASLKSSCELAKKYGAYSTFKTSPLSDGKFQFDLWNVKPSSRYDWESLRQDIVKYGVRNSLHVAYMPTASCQLGTNSILLKNGIEKSIYKIMEDDGIDWEKIEKIDQPVSIGFNKSIEVMTQSGLQKSKVIHYNGYKEIYDIEFEDGKIYSFTGNHLLKIVKDKKEYWKRVDQLSKNDEIVSI